MPRKTTAEQSTKSRISKASSRKQTNSKAGATKAERPSNETGCPVVGIGASAGGFEAVVQLLAKLPANTGMAFVIVLHLDPRHRSKLPELVARGTAMPVKEIRDGVKVEPDNVYILPSNADVLMEKGRLRLVPDPKVSGCICQSITFSSRSRWNWAIKQLR